MFKIRAKKNILNRKNHVILAPKSNKKMQDKFKYIKTGSNIKKI